MEKSINPKTKTIIVHAPNEQGRAFIKLLQEKSLPFQALVNNQEPADRLEMLGKDHILFLDLKNESILETAPRFQIRAAFLFAANIIESSIMTYIIRRWTYAPIYVVTTPDKTMPCPYKALGARFVVHSHSDDLGFLISDL